jgi:hypothetical protein
MYREVYVTPYNPTTKTGGVLIIEARNIHIYGVLRGTGAGYPGGRTDPTNCQGGKQGGSMEGLYRQFEVKYMFFKRNIFLKLSESTIFLLIKEYDTMSQSNRSLKL